MKSYIWNTDLCESEASALRKEENRKLEASECLCYRHMLKMDGQNNK